MRSADKTPDAASAHLFPGIASRYKDPPVIVGAEGCYLIDRAGRRFLDCHSSGSVMNAGHRNPAILNAVVDQLWRLQHAPPEYPSELAERLAALLAELAPGELSRSFFCAGNWEAIEMAKRLARSATGRPHIIEWSAPPHEQADRPASTNDRPHDVAIAAFERAVAEAGADKVAAVIAKPIEFDCDMRTVDVFWQTIREACDKHEILLIFDEMQTCMNRTGRWFACEHGQVMPDILVLAGALANGLPLAAVIATDDLVARVTMPPGPSFAAGPIACVGAVATISFHRTARLGHRAERQGGVLLDALTEVVQDSEHLTNARGIGLMIGVDVVDKAGRPDTERCDRYLEQLKNWGFFLGKAGGKENVLTITPPLTITEEQADLVVRAIEQLEQEN